EPHVLGLRHAGLLRALDQRGVVAGGESDREQSDPHFLLHAEASPISGLLFTSPPTSCGKYLPSRHPRLPWQHEDFVGSSRRQSSSQSSHSTSPRCAAQVDGTALLPARGQCTRRNSSRRPGPWPRSTSGQCPSWST